MSVLEQLADIEANLNEAKENYEEVIKYYQNQKKSFIKLYNKSGVEEKRIASNTFIRRLNEGIEKAFNPKALEIAEEYMDKLYDALLINANNEELHTNKNLKELAKKLKEEKEETGENTEKLLKSFSKELQKYYSDEAIIDKVKELLSNSFSNLKGFDYKTFTDRAISLRNSMYRNILNDDEIYKRSKQSYYMHSIKGSVEEAAIYDGLQKLANQIENNTKQYKIEVSNPGVLNEAGGADIKMTFFFPKSCTVIGQSKEIEIKDFGIQSKSWDLPWKNFEQASNSRMTLSKNKKLLDDILGGIGEEDTKQQTLHSWSLLVNHLSRLKNAIKATDDAFIWKLGNEFIYTEYLLREVFDNNYYISYAWSTKNYSVRNDYQLQFSKYRKSIHSISKT